MGNIDLTGFRSFLKLCVNGMLFQEVDTLRIAMLGVRFRQIAIGSTELSPSY
jgi:hypothetical protein